MASGKKNIAVTGDGGRTQRRARNAIQGARNRVAGKSFEAVIEAACEHYRAQGLADIAKMPEPVRQLGGKDGNGHFLACYEKRAQPDFKGTLSGGKSIVFEAKYTSTEKMARDVVLTQQEEALDSHAAMGAVCFVLVAFGVGDVYRVPWSVWSKMKEVYGRKYIKREDVERWRVPYRGGVLDFLGPVKGRGNTGAEEK